MSYLCLAILLWALGYICHERGKVVGIGMGARRERERMTRRSVAPSRERANWFSWS